MNTAVANPTRTVTASGNGLFARVGSFFALMGAVHRIKVAVECHQQPAAADLRTLGIDPAQMPKLHHGRV